MENPYRLHTSLDPYWKLVISSWNFSILNPVSQEGSDFQTRSLRWELITPFAQAISVILSHVSVSWSLTLMRSLSPALRSSGLSSDIKYNSLVVFGLCALRFIMYLWKKLRQHNFSFQVTFHSVFYISVSIYVKDERISYVSSVLHTFSYQP